MRPRRKEKIEHRRQGEIGERKYGRERTQQQKTQESECSEGRNKKEEWEGEKHTTGRGSERKTRERRNAVKGDTGGESERRGGRNRRGKRVQGGMGRKTNTYDRAR